MGIKEQKTLWTKTKGYFYLFYLKILRIRAEPKEIAKGLALGVFVGCFPIVPFQTAVVIPLTIIFRASKLAGFLGTFVSNPINMIPFYLMLFYIGSTVIPTDNVLTLNIAQLTMREIFNQGSAVFSRMMLGGAILGIPSALATYYITLPLLTKYKQKRLERRIEKAKERAKKLGHKIL